MSSIINATTLFDFMLSMINATTLFCTGIQKIPKMTMEHFHTDENKIGLKTNCIETATGKWLIKDNIKSNSVVAFMIDDIKSNSVVASIIDNIKSIFFVIIMR